MKETRKLPVKLTEAELTERRDALAARDQERVTIEIEKKAASRGFRERLKPVVEDITRISSEIISRTEVRDVECEVRDSLVNGQVEVMRLDTFEVIDTYMPGASVDDDEPDPNQPVLPFAVPPKPELRCTAIDEDGKVYGITPEQVDVVERQQSLGVKFATLDIDGATVDRIVRVLRAGACDTCGVVNGHRPECAGMKADDAADMTVDEAADTFAENADTYDRNDTAAVAAHIDGMTRPNDAPLTPVGEDTKPLVKLPKRKKAATEGEAAS